MQKASWCQTSVTVDLVLKTSFCKEDAFPVLHVEQIKILMKSNKEVRVNDTGDWRKLTQKLWSPLPVPRWSLRLWLTGSVSPKCVISPVFGHRGCCWKQRGTQALTDLQTDFQRHPPCMTASQSPSIFLWQLQNSGWWIALILWLDLLCTSALLLG